MSSEFVNVTESAHKVLGPGNFVLMMSESLLDGKPSAFYDLYRLEEGKQVEHWDVLETIPPPSALPAQGKNSLIAKKATSSEKEIPELSKEMEIVEQGCAFEKRRDFLLVLQYYILQEDQA